MEKLYRMLYPMRIVLITARHKEKDNIMPAAWCYPMSADPPLFGVAIAKKRFTYGLIHGSKAYGINLASPDMKDGVKICGSTSGSGADKFRLAGWKRENGSKTVLIADAPASIECEVIDEYEAGDHVIFVGKAIKVVKRREAKGLYHKGGEEFEVV